MNKGLYISIIQTELVWEDKAKNLLHFEACFSDVPEESRVIVLPEMFTTGFSMQPEKFAESMTGETVCWMVENAKSLKKNIVGSVIIEENQKFYNRLIWVEPNGDIHTYNKKHCFRYANEHLHYTPGKEELIVNIEGWNIGCYICYDLRFPVWSRNTNLKYDAALYIANWPERRAEHWSALLKARAIENQSYAIGVNRIGSDGNGIHHSGDSVVIGPKGNRISSTQPNSFSIETVVLSKKDLLEYRTQFPAYLDGDNFSLKYNG